MADSTKEENIKTLSKIMSDTKGQKIKKLALKKFKITFQKQRLWNEVLKIEKNADAQLGRSFEFALPKNGADRNKFNIQPTISKKLL